MAKRENNRMRTLRASKPRPSARSLGRYRRKLPQSKMRLKIIANPTAGKFKNTRYIQKLRKYLRNRGLSNHIAFTRRPGDAAEAARKILHDGYDAVAVCGVGELQPKDFSVVLGLLQSLARRGVGGLGLDDRNGQVRAVSENVIRTFAWSTVPPAAGDDNPPVGEGHLLVDAMWFVLPARGLELWDNVPSACVSFVGHRFHLLAATAGPATGAPPGRSRPDSPAPWPRRPGRRTDASGPGPARSRRSSPASAGSADV